MLSLPFTLPAPFTTRFHQESVLGHGGSSIIFRARQKNLDRLVALKLLRDDTLIDAQGRARFAQEARIAASLTHPNVLPVLDFGTEAGFGYIVFPLIEGSSLRKLLKNGPLPWRTARRYAQTIAEALTAIHSAGVIHRDLKPENVLVEPSGQLWVADFGISKPARSDIQTAVGTVLGTIGYIAPEQLNGGPATPFSDLYSLGVILWEMLAGFRPFERRDPKDATTARDALAEISACMTSGIPPLDALAPDVPAELIMLAQQLLSPVPEARIGSAEWMVRRLAQIDTRKKRPGSQAASGTRAPAPEDRTVPLLAPEDGTVPLGSPVPSARRTAAQNGVRLMLVLAIVLAAAGGRWYSTRPVPPPLPRPTPRASAAPTEPPVEIFEARRLENWEKGLTINFRRWSNPGKPECPVVVSSLDWAGPGVLVLEPGCRLVAINGKPFWPDPKNPDQLVSGQLRPGVNWLTFDMPADYNVPGVLKLPPQPCPNEFRERWNPPNLDFFDRLEYTFISPDKDSHKVARIEVARRWKEGTPMRKVADAWLDLYGGKVPIGLTQDSIVGMLFANETLPEAMRALHEFVDLLQESISRTPQVWEFWYALSWSLFYCGQHDAGLAASAKCLSLWPENYWAWMTLGIQNLIAWQEAQEAGTQSQETQRYWQAAYRYLSVAQRQFIARNTLEVQPYVRMSSAYLDRLRTHDSARPSPAAMPSVHR